MPQYHILWKIDLEAESPEDATLQALGIHRDPESIATVFSIEHQGVRQGEQHDPQPATERSP